MAQVQQIKYDIVWNTWSWLPSTMTQIHWEIYHIIMSHKVHFKEYCYIYRYLHCSNDKSFLVRAVYCVKITPIHQAPIKVPCNIDSVRLCACIKVDMWSALIVIEHVHIITSNYKSMKNTTLTDIKQMRHWWHLHVYTCRITLRRGHCRIFAATNPFCKVIQNKMSLRRDVW